ncbi:MAG: (Fe-S)-binding protein [Metallosphaera yellowstonensis]|jgi:Fe-S oxidoreductase|uniref:Fe-S oxidoreductase n=1 Tax=Metallosphaera yellowstonensis MK1 TaxID=671065 RepID=H2C7M4_9CREN|nr:(Fe-S)-binding protein [Metallosphaera yellowstonensis]EHP68150.1 Fe-S oxidoreductase [Metallosphaera yellowstonensis MK1]
MEGLRSLLLESLSRYGMPFPVDKKVCSSWTNELPRNGSTIIFTSCMYQIEPVVPILSKFGPYTGILRGVASLAKMVKPPKEELERAYRILNNIVKAIKRKGVDLAYLYEEEPYSGAVLLEMGMLDEFAEHARKVSEMLKERGITRVITVDPHTHNALKRYEEFVKFDVEVVSYLEVIDPSKKVEGGFTIHDSCLYSRFLNLREKYRSLILNSGISLKEDFFVTGRETSTCCGGPIGGVDPKLSEEIAKRRASELNRLSDKLLVVCPICYVTLSPHFKGEVKDVAEVIL